ncbi:hypothetical protein [Streptomyces sp. NPDC051576]|uniref:hypothetical protein n=1 Tax=Streptomyces sp. NPDC051576 TaxID=3155803 RepID=UPI00342FC3DF
MARLDWKTTAQLMGGPLFVFDEREVPEDIEQLAHDKTAAVMDRAKQAARCPRPP